MISVLYGDVQVIYAFTLSPRRHFNWKMIRGDHNARSLTSER